MARRSSRSVRRIVATLALVMAAALAVAAGPAHDGSSAGGGDGNWKQISSYVNNG